MGSRTRHEQSGSRSEYSYEMTTINSNGKDENSGKYSERFGPASECHHVAGGSNVGAGLASVLLQLSWYLGSPLGA